MALFGNDNSMDVHIRTTADTKGVNDVTSAITKLDKASGLSAKSAAFMGVTAGAAQSAITFLGGAIKNAGEAALDATGGYEQNRMAFETMLGSADKARDLMTKIADFAKTTPFELPEVVAGTKQLLAFGFAQEELLPTMRKIGDIASGVGVPVGQLTNVFGQVRVAGRLMGQDLLQFTNAGVPMIEALAKTMGKPQEEIKKLVERGQVGFKDVEKALNSLTGEGSKFGGMMDKQSKTFNGVVSNIKDGFGQILRSALGMTQSGDIVKGGIFDRIKQSAEAMMPVVQKAAEKVGPFMQKVIEKATELYDNIASYLEPKIVALGNAFKDDLAPALQKFWKETLEPLMPVIGETLVAAFGAVIDIITGLITALSSIIEWINNNKPIVLGLATAFGIVAGSMAFQSAVAGFQASMTIVTGTIIPSVMTSLAGLQVALTGFTGWAVFAAVAVGSFIAIQKAIDDLEASLDVLQSDLQGLSKAEDDYRNSLKRSLDSGKIDKSTYDKRLKDYNASINSGWNSIQAQGFATGGFTGRGAANEIAGVVHKGEFVVPKDKVDQSTGMPKGLGVVSSKTVNIQQVIINTAEAANAFFDRLDNDSMLAGKGLATIGGNI